MLLSLGQKEILKATSSIKSQYLSLKTFIELTMPYPDFGRAESWGLLEIETASVVVVVVAAAAAG